MDNNTREIMFSSNRSDWETPQKDFDEWNEIYNFELDLAASKYNSKCGLNYIDEELNSLDIDWHTLTDGWMFLNPPYDKSKEFIEKCDEEAQKGARIVCLLPARTDTIAFHDRIYKKYEIDLLKGRLKFEIDGKPILNKKGRPQSAPFPSMLIFFEKNELILDPCCGGRQFWFDKENSNVLFADERVMNPIVVGKGKDARVRKCLPDKVMDFRNMDISDRSFKLVVFDPPHLFLGENSYMIKSYGTLDKQTWKEDIRKGFSECFRVLKNEGVLIFKWNESDILLKEILKLTPYKPLFGHSSGKLQKTHWICFMKIESEEK